MKQINITITLEKAKEWYNSDNAALKEIALQAFSEGELNTYSFQDITTFEEALNALGYKENTKVYIKNIINDTSVYSKASAAMFKLNIVRKALNIGYNMHLTKNANGQCYTYYPCFRFVTRDSTHYNNELKSGIYKKLGKVISEGITYDVLGGCINSSGGNGLGDFYYNATVGSADVYTGFLGCATKEIAKHFGRYFGMLIIEAMYGDMVNYNIESTLKMGTF